MSYITDSSATQSAFDFASIPKISKEQARQESQRARAEISSSLQAIGNGAMADAKEAEPINGVADGVSLYSKQLSAVPDFSTYGEVLRSSSKPIELTESETEYVITAVKHIYKEHVVFQVSFLYAAMLRLLMFAISSTCAIRFLTPCWRTSRWS